MTAARFAIDSPSTVMLELSQSRAYGEAGGIRCARIRFAFSPM
jgi:hypothetical protein